MGLPDQATVMYVNYSTSRVGVHFYLVNGNLMLLFKLTILFQAYMYGFFKNKRIVLYDTLIQQVLMHQKILLLPLILFHKQ
jgi:hypothetical protein